MTGSPHRAAGPRPVGGAAAEDFQGGPIGGPTRPAATRPAGAGDALASDSPWRERRFWAVQGVVLLLCFGRLLVEVQVTQAHAIVPGIPDFTTTGLFLVPVLYAAVTFGATGGVATTAWLALLTVPRDLVYVQGADPVGVWAESTQVAMLCVVAVVVGRRVAAEHVARLQAEEARRSHLAAEARYRSLFESNSSPILLTDRAGTVVERNPAAAAVFGPAPAGRARQRLADLVGADLAGRLLQRAATGLPPTATDAAGEMAALDVDGLPHRFRATATRLGGGRDGGLVQLVLVDVSAEAERQRLAESFAGTVLEAQEEERRHLAHELHDGPLQELVHLTRQLDAAGRQPDAQELLGDMRQRALRLVDELRRIARGLRPSVLDDLGLVAALGRLLEDLQRRTGVATSIGVTGDERRLPPPVELAVFRVAQEALANAERHADPARVAVGIGFEPSTLRLLVTDDGCGFDAATAGRDGRPGSIGVFSMAERVHLLGGTVTIHSAPGRGTTVEAAVPLPPAGRSGAAAEPVVQVESPM